MTHMTMTSEAMTIASRVPGGLAGADRAMNYELVKVIDRSMLLDPVQMRRPYRTSTGRPLERGIYAVVWSADAPVHDYDGDAHFYGPFRAWREASAFVRDTVGGRS